MRTRKITMTVSKVEAELINVSTPGTHHVTPGHIWVEATDGHEYHRWPTQNRNWIVGEQVEVEVTDADPQPHTDDGTTAPPLTQGFVLGEGDTLHDASTHRSWRYSIDARRWIENL